MTRIITIIALTIAGMLSAQSKDSVNLVEAVSYFNQNQYQEAKNLFEKEVEANEKNWLPNYYLALIYSIEALENNGKQEKMKVLLEKAQQYQDKANRLQPENAEVMIVQAMIHTGWIVYNPMVYGRDLSLVVDHLYNKAVSIDPNNPRVVLQKASYDIGKAKYFGQDTQQYCAEVAKAIELFSTFKPESSLHPSWGLILAEKTYSNCNQ